MSAAAASSPAPGSTANAGKKRVAEAEADARDDAMKTSDETEQQAAAAACKRARKGDTAAAAAAPSSAASAAAASSPSAAASAPRKTTSKKYMRPGRYQQNLKLKAAAAAQHKPDHGTGHSVAAAATGPDTATAHSLMDDETSQAAAPSHASSAAAPASSSAASSSATPAAAVSNLAVLGGKYTGSIVDGKPEGNGRLVGPNHVYTGDFSQGKKCGVGMCRWNGGRVYAGQWKDNKRVGLGVQWNAKGKLTECGRWQDDKLVKPFAVPLRLLPEGKWLRDAARQAKRDPDGSLVLLGENGRFFVGEVNAQGQPHGQGASFNSDGSPFESLQVDRTDASLSGRWDKGKLNGRATMFHASGDRYEGLFKDDQRHGLGSYRWEDGSRYEGQFVAGDFNGLGAKWDEDGELIKCGQWTDDKLVKSCAVPLRCIPEGKHLSATALQAKRDHPDGSALLSRGVHYIGTLNADGQPDGQGASFHPDGSPEITLIVDGAADSGRWVNGKVNGRATQMIDNVDRYEGPFKDGLREGVGSYSWNDGSRYEGEWEADKRNGLGAEWDEDGKLDESGRCADDKLVEKCAVPLRLLPDKRFLSDHAKTASLLFPDGGYFVGPINARNQRHGEGSMFSAAGDLLSNGTWSNDQLQSKAASSVSAQVAPAPSAAATSAASASAVAAPSSSSPSSSAVQLPLQCSNRKALIIGNSKYKAPVKSLSCCTNDAKDMQAALKQLGFQCTRLLNAPRKQINEVLSKFIASLEKNDIVFFHFSGHGEESAGVTYLLPTDYGDSKSLEDEAVSLNKIMQRLNLKNYNLVNIIVLDCCRANVHDDTFRGGDEIERSARDSADDRGGQSSVRKLTNAQFFVAYSSDPGTVSFETRGGRNGWFTGCLLPYLRTPDLHLEQIFKRTLRDLNSKSEGKQQSWSHTKLTDDVVLFPTQEPL